MSLMPESTMPVENMKQHYLAKSWLESILQHELPSEDLYTSLKDGIYLYESVLLKVKSKNNVLKLYKYLE